MTPSRISAPPRNWVATGSWCSRIQANATANSTSAIATNDPNFAPSRRAAAIPVTYAIAAATRERPSSGTIQLTSRPSSVTSPPANRSGTSPVSPSAASTAAPTTIPPQVSTSGGSAAEPSADWKKYTAIATAAASAHSTPGEADGNRSPTGRASARARPARRPPRRS